MESFPNGDLLAAALLNYASVNYAYKYPAYIYPDICKRCNAVTIRLVYITPYTESLQFSIEYFRYYAEMNDSIFLVEIFLVELCMCHVIIIGRIWVNF